MMARATGRIEDQESEVPSPKAGGDSKTRVAIGVYDSRELLEAAVERLLSYKFTEAQLGILALRSTLIVATEIRPSDADARRVIEHLIDTAEPVRSDGTRWGAVVASRGIGQATAARLTQPAVTRVWRGDGSWSGTSRELEEQLRDGAIVLAVAAETPDQQQMSAQILLESSIYPIETLGLSSACRLPHERLRQDLSQSYSICQIQALRGQPAPPRRGANMIWRVSR